MRYRNCADCSVVYKRDDVDVLNLRKGEDEVGLPISQRIANGRMIRDQCRFCDLVIHTRPQFKASDVLRMSWRLVHGYDFAAEKRQSGSKQQTANKCSNAGKPKEGCAHNFHSYKNENTPSGL